MLEKLMFEIQVASITISLCFLCFFLVKKRRVKDALSKPAGTSITLVKEILLIPLLVVDKATRIL